MSSTKSSRQSLVELELELKDQGDEGFSHEMFPVGLGCALDMFREKEEVFQIIERLPNVPNERRQMEIPYQKYCTILDRYQEQPHLLDRHIEGMIELLLSQFRASIKDKKEGESESAVKHLSLKFLRHLFKVRGPKEVVKRMPHEISDLVPVLVYLENENLDNPETWESGYVLLMWLSILVINPFHLRLLDGRETGLSIADRLMRVCKKCVGLNNNVGQAAPFLVARFLTRPDMQEIYLDSFVDWTCKSLGESTPFGTRNGAFASLAAIFKQAKRQEVLKYGEKVVEAVIKSKYENCDSVLRKAGVKLLQRVGMMFLKQKVAPWRYQRGNRSLLCNLKGETTLPESKLVAQNGESDANHEDYSEITQFGSVIESVIDKLLDGLKDKYTIVRWSSAKGIGRVTNRLPKDLANEVVEGVLQNFNPRENHASWHGGCLALAELARRGLLLPERIPQVIPVINKALVFDELQGSFSIGGHVRDAACYVLWAFARAFEPDVIQPYVTDIASSLIIVICFDREVNCRRAASAAYQENVGRQGNFPHGIDIVPIADYFSVGMRTNAFVKVSSQIAQFKTYTLAMIDHLMELKFNHFDEVVREVTALALGELSTFEPEYVRESVIPKLAQACVDTDLYTSHGALLSLGKILVCLKKKRELKQLKDETVKMVGRIVPTIIEKKFGKSGQRGNDMLQQGINSFISCCSKAKMPYHSDDTFISACRGMLEKAVAAVDHLTRESAAKALAQFLTEYYHNNPSKQGSLQEILDHMGDSLKTPSMTTRQGFAYTLGRLSINILQTNFKKVVESLLQCSTITKETEMWAESRRDAINAVSRLFLQQKLTRTDDWGKGIPLDLVEKEKILSTLISGIEDYTTDKRGDIGSWVRIASVSALKVIFIRLNECEELGNMDSTLITNTMGLITKQCVEKIDNVRTTASQVFAALIHQKCMNAIPKVEKLKQIFPEDFCQTVNWRTSSVAYPKFVELLSFEEYTYHVLEGFVISGGSLSDSVMKDANAAVTSYLIASGAMGDQELIRIGGVLLNIFENNPKNDRVTLPFMKFLVQLMQSGIFLPLLKSQNEPFGVALVDLTRNELLKCGRVDKINLGVELMCEMLQGNATVAHSALKKLMIYLGHAFPRVRVVTSQKLYEALITYGLESLEDDQDKLEQVMSLLTDTQWDMGKAADYRLVRSQICQCLNIPEPMAMPSPQSSSVSLS